MMAFIRRKGEYYYLVHSVRDGDTVKQITLAYLGKNPYISNEMRERVEQEHPDIDIAWDELMEVREQEDDDEWLKWD